MKKMRHFAIAAIAAASFSAMAATDGSADASQSVGSFTNTFGSTPAAQIRVFGLKDAVMDSNSGSVNQGYGGTNTGAADTFCVANTTGQSVTIRLTSTGLSAGDGVDTAIATDSATGDTLAYHQTVALNSNISGTAKIIASGSNAFVVSAPQTSVTDCSSPNMYKSIIRAAGAAAPTTGVYTDLVTVTATLN